MPKPGPRTTYKYSDEFKATAVRLSQLGDVAVQDVAEALYIHPFMLSRWRKQAREGLIVTKGVEVDKDVAAELKALRRMKRDYERLKLEHEILKKASDEQKASLMTDIIGVSMRPSFRDNSLAIALTSIATQVIRDQFSRSMQELHGALMEFDSLALSDISHVGSDYHALYSEKLAAYNESNKIHHFIDSAFGAGKTTHIGSTISKSGDVLLREANAAAEQQRIAAERQAEDSSRRDMEAKQAEDRRLAEQEAYYQWQRQQRESRRTRAQERSAIGTFVEEFGKAYQEIKNRDRRESAMRAPARTMSDTGSGTKCRMDIDHNCWEGGNPDWGKGDNLQHRR
ncbi:MAG: transposase [Pseudomonadota bacterium]